MVEGGGRDKTVVGYCEPLSMRAGESVTLFASSHVAGPVGLDIVRIVCGDPTRSGPGFEERPVVTSVPTEVHLAEQPLLTGSWGAIELGDVVASGRVVMRMHVMATRPHLSSDRVGAARRRGRGGPRPRRRRRAARVVTGGGALRSVRPTPIEPGRWYRVEVALDVAAQTATVGVVGLPSRSPGRDLMEPDGPAEVTVPVAWDGSLGQLLLGRGPAGDHFDGRLGELALDVDGTTRRWDLSRRMATRAIVEVGGLGPDGVLHQLPTRAVTGSRWDGSTQALDRPPEHYAASTSTATTCSTPAGRRRRR